MQRCIVKSTAREGYINISSVCVLDLRGSGGGVEPALLLRGTFCTATVCFVLYHLNSHPFVCYLASQGNASTFFDVIWRESSCIMIIYFSKYTFI